MTEPRSPSNHRSSRYHPSAALVGAAVAVGLALFVVLLGIPLASLLFRLPASELVRQLGRPLVTQALWLSLVTSLGATLGVILLGLPVAYLLATRSFTGKRIVEALVDVPMVLPPTVAGVGLLLAFGRAGLVGQFLFPLGITLPFTTVAVVMAQMFVAAPFFINTTRAGFESVEPRYIRAAATLRASPAYTFLRVILPLSVPSLLAGAATSWARSLGEFGATIIFAGNLPGRTQTMPLAVYVALQSDVEAAVALSVILLLVSFALLVLMRLVPAALPR